MSSLWAWQSAALERVKEYILSIIEACPGSGKTTFSGALAKHWLDSSECDHVIAIAPSLSIKRGIAKTWFRRFGLQSRWHLVDKGMNAFRIPTADATVITYHELRNTLCEDALRLWTSQGWKFGVVFDEIHHAASPRQWGDRVSVIGKELASRACIMTGTPFRTDGEAIELMKYVSKDGLHVADPDCRYTYREAVEDRVCRPVACRWIDGEIPFDSRKRGKYVREISKLRDYELDQAKSVFFDPNGEPMTNLVRQVHYDLMRHRSDQRYANAGALFVCQTGHGMKGKKVDEFAKTVERITGIRPTVVKHDDEDSVDKIEAFREGNDPYIVAVNMISEGVDIPRLRLVAFCRYTDSEMLFRQIVGRVLRKTLENDEVPATMYVPRFPQMQDFAQRLWDEAKNGLKDRPPTDVIIDINLPPVDGTSNVKNLVALDAHAIAGAGRFDDIDVERQWIGVADRVSRMHTTYRHYNSVHLGAVLKTASQIVGDEFGVDEPQELANLFDRLNRRVRRLAGYSTGGDFAKAWATVFAHARVSCLEDIRAFWCHERVEKLISDVDEMIGDACFERGGK